MGALNDVDSACAGECWPLRHMQTQAPCMGWTKRLEVESACLREGSRPKQRTHARHEVQAHPDAGEAHVGGMAVMDPSRRRIDLQAQLVVLQPRHI